MTAEGSKGWRVATVAAIVLWLGLAVRLMIADVWDETNGMLFFSSAATSLGDKLRFVLTQSLGFWRPLPTLLLATVLHLVPDFDVSWRVLRAINIVALIAAFALLVDALRSWRFDGSARVAPWRTLLFALAFFYSSSAVITAGWFANAFDAFALLAIAAGLALLARERAIAAGVVFGLAFFCKETAALILPFLLVLLAAGRITFRQSLRAGIPAAILGAIYFVFRSKIVPFGTAGDVHGFAAEQLVPTILNLAGSFWLQSMKQSGFAVAGIAFLVVSLAALRRPRLIAAVLLFYAGVALIYWGMFAEYQNGVLMHHLNFVGRLYLVPATLLLFLLLLERRIVAVAVLTLPIVFGAVLTWRDHARFQSTYARIYRTAADATVRPLRVHYPTKPLDDQVRGVVVGDLPDAPVVIDPKSGRLEFR
jgi:hypothetical protein